MQLATLGTDTGTTQLARIGDDGLEAIDGFSSVDEWLARGCPELPAAGRVIAAPRWAPPVRPGKIVAIGLNYADHVRETGMAVPERPLVFAKFPSSVVGAHDPIELPAVAEPRVDWEVELAVVVGRRMRNVAEADALSHVLGYTVADDVSARGVQFADGQWVRGKSFDTFCPLGPVLVTADELPDPQGLALSTDVNGERVQDSTTAEMLFGVAELLAFCSAAFTLEPGDVVLTGTPWGCGEFMTPRRSLQAGDEVVCRVEGIGELRNRVIAPRAAPASISTHDVRGAA